MAENVEAAGAGKESEGRRRRPMEVPAELDSRFLRVGDKLYRSAHDKQPVATITPDRIKAKDRDSLPDLIRLAKEMCFGYDFRLIDDKSPITEDLGYVLFAHNVLMHIPDEELDAQLARFEVPRVIVSEVLGRRWRRAGDPPVFNREIEEYVRAFDRVGYEVTRCQYRPTPHYGNRDAFAIVEAHRR